MKNRTYEELEVPYFTDRTRASLKYRKAAIIFARSVLSRGHVD